jgi:hypothetical protein
MFTAGELAAMTATVEATIGPDSGLGTSITLYRGSSTLAAQDARLVRPSALNRNVATDGTEGAQNDALLVGKPGMNIQARDRFSLNGITYEVLAVQPQRQIKTVAQVRMVQ